MLYVFPFLPNGIHKKMPFAFCFDVKNFCYTFHVSLQYQIIAPSLEVCIFVAFRDSSSILIFPFAVSEL